MPKLASIAFVSVPCAFRNSGGHPPSAELPWSCLGPNECHVDALCPAEKPRAMPRRERSLEVPTSCSHDVWQQTQCLPWLNPAQQQWTPRYRGDAWSDLLGTLGPGCPWNLHTIGLPEAASKMLQPQLRTFYCKTTWLKQPFWSCWRMEKLLFFLRTLGRHFHD